MSASSPAASPGASSAKSAFVLSPLEAEEQERSRASGSYPSRSQHGSTDMYSLVCHIYHDTSQFAVGGKPVAEVSIYLYSLIIGKPPLPLLPLLPVREPLPYFHGYYSY